MASVEQEPPQLQSDSDSESAYYKDIYEIIDEDDAVEEVDPLPNAFSQFRKPSNASSPLAMYNNPDVLLFRRQLLHRAVVCSLCIAAMLVQHVAP